MCYICAGLDLAVKIVIGYLLVNFVVKDHACKRRIHYGTTVRIYVAYTNSVEPDKYVHPIPHSPKMWQERIP